MSIVTVNSLSGGETSSYMAVYFPADINIFAVVCIDTCKHKTDPYLIRYTRDKFEKFCPEYPFFSVTAEQDKTLKAMIELEQYIGKEIVWVRGRGFDEIINERHRSVLAGNRYRLPSWARRYCTEQMKINPIFEYLYYSGKTPCLMNIGFRSDEEYRIRKFYKKKDGTSKNPHFHKMPVSCNTFGKRLTNWESVYFRRARFPLYEHGIKRIDTRNFWKGKIDFPRISNCVGCFHKNIETINAMCNIESMKMQWFIEQEKKGMGTWRDDRITYETISLSKLGTQLTFEDFEECESEGCTN